MYDNKGQFRSHFQDFVAVIDVESLMGDAIKYIYDPEVLQFVGFMSNPQLKKISKMTSGKGVTGLIEELMKTLPLEDMKKLFEIKLESSAEVAQLFDTINSEEVLGILRRMSKNLTFLDFKSSFKLCYLCRRQDANSLQKSFI
ncbi:uncharacterized protein LOC115445046 [Manduca sexta]|uniref:uncharacterized protein LOC115445046 n=1 Tax=Manduca sexta TaxID=7130 RepID=UPI0011831437|nr:uncharacterized protein LOC115445046 [Manduca sexta]